jgi:hypothetical protein
MTKKLMILFAALTLGGGLSAQAWKDKLNQAKDKLGGGALSQEEVGRGLKEALDLGVAEAVDFLSAENGYYQSAYKILMPEEAQQLATRLRAVPGFANFEEDALLKINRAAEDAAQKAKPIFVSAIRQMTFQDAMNLLRGNQDAATRYLERTTFQQLYNEFKPVIIASLDKFNARDYWRDGVSAYNKIPMVSKVNPELDDYVTRQALAGMFGLVEKKELDIRQNAGARTSDLLRRVFAQQD